MSVKRKSEYKLLKKKKVKQHVKMFVETKIVN